MTETLPWWRVRSLIQGAASDDDPPGLIAGLDQYQAQFCNRLTELEVDARDPGILYVVLVVLGVLWESAGQGRKTGVLTEEEEQGVKRVVVTIAGALVPILPAEAKS